MTNYQKIYNELRPYVSKERLREYDNEFLKRKRPSYQFMIPYLYEFIGERFIRRYLKDPKLLEFFYLQEDRYHEEKDEKLNRSKLMKSIREAKETPRHRDKKFLFKDIDKKDF